MFCKKGVLINFVKLTRKHRCQSLFIEACNFIKKEILTQVCSCEFCEICKNNCYYRTPLVAASGVLINFAILEPFLTEYLWWLLLTFRCSKYFFAAEHGIYCRQWHKFLKTRVKPQKWPPKLFRKKEVLRKFSNFPGRHLCRSLFLIELQTFRPATLLKRDSNTDVFLSNLQTV